MCENVNKRVFSDNCDYFYSIRCSCLGFVYEYMSRRELKGKKMKNVSVIVPERAVIEAVADPHYMFNAVNQFLISSGK